MVTGPHVRAGWVLWGKEPGSNSDYSVLAASADPLSPPEFASILTHFAPGTPPAEDGLPSSLPWVIISRVGIEDRHYLGMAIQRSTEHVDGTGRPITETSYFCIPYSELADSQVSYADLFLALEKIKLPYEGSGLIELDVSRLDPSVFAGEINREFGEESVAGAAALLLNGDVSIVASDRSTVFDRLRYLDAVAAMLPYGYRADLTAATWSDSSARHQIRLAFAAKAREGAGVVRWHSAPDRLPGTDPGGNYHRALQQIRERSSGDQQGSLGQLTDLIRFLAADREPCLFAQPERAITSLREFDLPFFVLNAVLAGTARPQDVRAVFLRSLITELPPEGRRTLMAALIGLADPQDIATVRTWWDVVVGEDSATMLPALVRTSRDLLWAPTPSLGVKKYLDLAASLGLQDALLAELVAMPASMTEPNGALGAAAQLLADTVLSAHGADFTATQQAMSANPLVACEVLAQVAGSERDARQALAWLQGPLGGFLHPFAAVLGDLPQVVEPGEFGQLARQSEVCVRNLLQAASYAGRLNFALPGFTTWLAHGAIGSQASAGASRRWYDLAWALAPADAYSQAWLDLALLLMGNDLRFLLAPLGQPNREQYNEIFARAWQELSDNAGQATHDRMSNNLIAYLARAPWRVDAVQIDIVVDLVGLLTSAGSEADLESAVTESLLASRETARRESAQAWLARVRPTHHVSGGGDVLLSLRSAHPGFTDVELAGLCVQGYQENLDPQDVCRALADSQAIDSGAKAIGFLDALKVGLYSSSAGPQDPLTWQGWFISCLADSADPQLAREFKQLAVRIASAEIKYFLDLLYIAATGGRQGSQVELSDAEIAQLEWIPKSVDRILKEAKKRPGWSLKSRIGKHSRDEEGGEPQKVEQETGADQAGNGRF